MRTGAIVFMAIRAKGSVFTYLHNLCFKLCFTSYFYGFFRFYELC